MTQENEKLRALCVAQEAEIARLQRGFDDLKAWCSNEKIKISNDIWSKGYSAAFSCILVEINRITGENK